MKKLYFMISILLFGMSKAQIYTPNGNINGTTSNPETNNVGIGTTNPQAKLDVNGDMRINSSLLYSSGDANKWFIRGLANGPSIMMLQHSALSGSGNRRGSLSWMDNNGNQSEILTWAGSGNVGIGTVNPEAQLDVHFTSLGEPKSMKFMQFSNTINTMNAALRFTWYDDTADFGMVRSGSTPIEALAVRFNGMETARFTPNGNLGIGTTTPTSKLTVAGDIAYGEAFSNTLFRDDAGAMGVGIKSGFYQTSNPINYPTGATSWWHLLDVRHSNVNNNYAMQFSGGFWDQELWFRKTSDNGSQPWRRVVMEQTNGNVGIGTVAPQAKLHIDFAGEPKSILFREAEGNGNAINSMISMMRFKWYDNTADFGMVRSGSTPIEALAVRFNEQETARFTPNGNVSIKNKLEAKEVKVTTTPTADFVFAEGYQLPKLEAVEKHIKEKKHLPEIASAKEMEKEGVNVGEFQIKLLQKIEELTLYSIEQNNKNKEQEQQLKVQTEKIEKLEKMLLELTNKK